MKVYKDLDMHGARVMNTPDIFDVVNVSLEEFTRMQANHELSPSTYYNVYDETGSVMMAITLSSAEFEELKANGQLRGNIFYIVYDDTMEYMIDDTAPSSQKTYSSEKIEAMIKELERRIDAL